MEGGAARDAGFQRARRVRAVREARVLRPVPRCPGTTGPSDPQISGKHTGPEPPQDSAWVGGPLFPGGSWDPEIRELWKWSRTATSEVEWPGLWSQC